MGVKKKDSRPGSGIGGILIPMGKSTFLLGTVFSGLFRGKEIFFRILTLLVKPYFQVHGM